MPRLIKFTLLLLIIPASMIVYNELLYFSGWKDKTSTPNNEAPVHFYVVNLERQEERFLKFKGQTDKYGINLERVSATDGYQVKFVDQETKDSFSGFDIKAKTKSFEPNHKYDVYCTNTDKPEFTYHAFEALPRALTPGEIGLDCSYRLLWKKISSSPTDQIAIIFEDDAILLEDFDQNFSQFIKTLPLKWDIAYLDADVLPLKKHLPYSARWVMHLPELTVNDYFIKIHTETNVERTHAYTINKKSAQKLLSAHDNDTSVPIDYAIARAIQQRIITAYIANNKIASYDEAAASEISSMGRNEFGN